MRLFFALLSIVLTLSTSANQLQNHSSPYLALHGNDPVNWMEWGKPALDKAKKENKLLFVSIGYFACHWCHVMQRESYADKGIAQQLNKNYISIKVDRELNPVLDKRLIEFVQVTNGTAGWPLNVFITPDGYPLVGATYMPREHFSNVLKQLDEKWKTEKKSLNAQAKDMSKTLITMLERQEQSTNNMKFKELSASFIDTALEYADTLQGGFGQQRKFPQIPQLWAMLKLNKIKQSPEADEFIKLTLKKMSQKGLHDDIAGGFYRYTTDPDWETPHFEKMLYTNAMMPLLYFDAADQYKNDAYKNIALETLTFLKNEMRGQSNAFIASLSAVDNKGEEGGYYLWQQQELKKVLNSQELKIANLYWNMKRANELAAGNLPRQELTINELSNKLKISPTQAKKSINNLKRKLKNHRNKTRIIPRDTKLLAGMNGLTLAAFSQGIAYKASLKPTGEKLAQFLMSLWNGKTLRRSAANAKQGTLYDYAAVSWGLMKWGKASNSKQSIKVATAIATAAWDRFYKNSNWIENPDSLLPQGVKQTHISDSALISAEALLLEASDLSKDPKLIAYKNAVLNNVTRSLETDVFAFATLFTVF
jgi:uncharacterized protein YyaL (SSP411 family)